MGKIAVIPIHLLQRCPRSYFAFWHPIRAAGVVFSSRQRQLVNRGNLRKRPNCFNLVCAASGSSSSAGGQALALAGPSPAPRLACICTSGTPGDGMGFLGSWLQYRSLGPIFSAAGPLTRLAAFLAEQGPAANQTLHPASALPNRGRQIHSARPLALFFRLKFGCSAPHLDGPSRSNSHHITEQAAYFYPSQFPAAPLSRVRFPHRQRVHITAKAPWSTSRAKIASCVRFPSF